MSSEESRTSGKCSRNPEFCEGGQEVESPPMESSIASFFSLEAVDFGNRDAVSIQFEYDPDQLATKTTTQLDHTSNSKTYV